MCHTLPDHELLTLLRAGESQAFSEIYERYWESLSLYTLKVIQSKEDALDIVQEVFVSIWKRRTELNIEVSLNAYLFKCVRNLSIKYIEKNNTKRNFLSTLSLSFQDNDLTNIDALELKELEIKIDNAVAKLPPKMREIYLLSRQENLSYRQIAEQLEIAETTVKKQVSNALKILRLEIGTLTPTGLLLAVFLLD